MKANAMPAAAVAVTTSLKLWLPWRSANRSIGSQHAARATRRVPTHSPVTQAH